MRRAETGLGGGRVSSLFDSVVTDLALRLGLDHPKRMERARSGLLIGLVAFLVLLVFSSIVVR
jgi:hypothetical protein